MPGTIRTDPEITAPQPLEVRPARHSSGAIYVVLGTALGVVLLGMLLLLGPLVWLQRVLTGPGARPVVTESTVVRNIRQLQRLESVVYTLDQVITGEKKNPVFPPLIAGDRLLLIVHGEVTAGVDFSGLRAEDVSIQGKTIRLKIRPAEVLSTRIDNQKTRVYSRDTGLFSVPDPNLETELRRQAEAQLTQAALDDGILKIADQNARASIMTLLRSVGFEQVELTH
jgi:hypothetical protein